MATKITSRYIGDGLVENEHGTSGSKIVTDLPSDNGGKGRMFSPTDLFATSYSSCILTIMGAFAEKSGKDITGTVIEIEKHMQSEPRRIGKMILTVQFPKHVQEEEKEKYMRIIRSCPVGGSLHPDVVVEVK